MNCLGAGDWRPDAIAARALLNAAPPGRIAVAFDWGEYVIWHFGPTLQVAYDPKYDLVYSPRAIAEQDAVEKAEPEGLAFLQRTRPDEPLVSPVERTPQVLGRRQRLSARYRHAGIVCRSQRRCSAASRSRPADVRLFPPHLDGAVKLSRRTG